MKTKDGRASYGSGRTCDCGNPATVKSTGYFICERCDQIQKKVFKDSRYCGILPNENGEGMQVHGWRSQTSKTHRSEFE